MPHRVFDPVQIRCPRLGGPVTFGYCRQVDDGLPCHKALVCFERQFPAGVYFRKVLLPETFERCFNTPAGCRYEKILGALRTAQEATSKTDSLTPPPAHEPPDDAAPRSG